MKSFEDIVAEMATAINRVDELEKENESMTAALEELSDYCELHSENVWSQFQDILDNNGVYLTRAAKRWPAMYRLHDRALINTRKTNKISEGERNV